MISLFVLILQVAKIVLGYLETKQLLDAGEAKEIARNLNASLEITSKGKRFRDAALDEFDKRGGVPDERDPNLRD